MCSLISVLCPRDHKGDAFTMTLHSHIVMDSFEQVPSGGCTGASAVVVSSELGLARHQHPDGPKAGQCAHQGDNPHFELERTEKRHG